MEISPEYSLEELDAEAEAPILWPPDLKYWLIGKYPDAGKDWRQEEQGMIEDQMVGWHHQVNGHEFEQALGVAKIRTWLSDWTELNWSDCFKDNNHDRC